MGRGEEVLALGESNGPIPRPIALQEGVEADLG